MNSDHSHGISECLSPLNELDALLSSHAPSELLSWTLHDEIIILVLQDLAIELRHVRWKPISVHAASAAMPRKLLDELRSSLRVMLAECGSQMRWSGHGVMVEDANNWLCDWRAGLIGVTAFGRRSGDHGDVDLGSIEDSAKHLLGQSIAEMCQKIPEYLRIIHVEPVFRNNLVHGFLTRQAEIKNDLLTSPTQELRRLVPPQELKSRRLKDDKEGLADLLAQPKVTFHGAPRHVVSSIVRYGFLLPGSLIGKLGAPLQTANGATFGAGISSSPDPQYASSYMDYSPGSSRQRTLRACVPSQVPGMRLLVCATLMGRALQVTRNEARRTTELQHNDAHSHVSPNGLEYVVFDARQIVPCYVLHLDYGSERAKEELARMPALAMEVPRRRLTHEPRKQTGYDDADGDGLPGVVKARKEALKAAATKWFPYGYGTARGTNFVVEEVAEVSDDEEDYGDFQGMRVEKEEMRGEGRRETDGQGWNWFDEYQTVRKTNREMQLV
ncbi:hypothetical protein LTR82_016095 [Friedmanniomyces endolithicus]|uniref:PARP catalytic domain-containing protein n=1 Tax=Friedmanniomyces endolithicus TaxID=329885 RepID=A0AAN6F990_9PEZI|nr:hypothetical protein LTR82_016095 [Friedmanniomyces endolithicus]